MARYKSEPTAIQQDAVVFEAVKADIKRFTADYLTTLVNVSRPSFYKYMRGEAIDQRVEDLILDAIEKAKELKSEKDEARLNRAKELTAA